MNEIEAAALAAAARRKKEADQIAADIVAQNQGPANDGSEFFANPYTGQMTSRELLANNMQPNVAQAAQIGAMQGLSFSGADEVIGGVNAALPGPGTMGERFKFGQEYTRAADEAAMRDHKGVRIGSEVAGGAMTGAAAGYGALPRTAGLGQKTIAGGLIGTGEGAVYGALEGEGLEGRARSARNNAAVGGTVGAMVPPALAGLRAGRNAVVNPIAGALNIGNDTRANSAFARALRNSGKSMDEIEAYLASAVEEGQDVVTMADAMGDAGQRALSGVTSQPGPGRTMAAGLLDARQADQGDRIAQFLVDGFGADQTADAARAGIRSARDEAADVAYTAARQQAAPVDIRGAVRVIDDRIGGMQGRGVAGDGTDGALAKVRARLMSTSPEAMGDDVSSIELSDFDRVLGVKQDVQDMIGVAVRQGRNNEARELGKVVRALDEALETSSDAYRSANDDFAAASRVAESVDRGQGANRPSVRAEDWRGQYSSMTPDQQSAARVGYADRLLAQVENAAPGANKARPLQSTRQQQNISLMADNPDRLARQIQREADMFETRRVATGGSQTADKLAEQAAVNGEDIGIIANLLAGRVGSAAGQAIGRGVNAMRGANEGTRTEIARLLLSRDPKALSRALLMAETREGRNRVVEALMRGGGRTGGAIALPD